MLRAAAIAVALAVTLAACGPPPGVERATALLRRGDYQGATEVADAHLAERPRTGALWRIKIRAALLAGDSERAVHDYGEWRRLRGEHDEAALERMAKLTLWRGLMAPSAELQVAAIQAVERLEIEELADEVAQLVAADDDWVAAAAAVALLRSHPYGPRTAADLLRSADERARAVVIEGIGRKIPEQAADELRAALSDPSPRVRRRAVGAVAALGEPSDGEALAALAGSDPDKEVRARALRTLAAGTYRPAVDVARTALADDYLGARVAALSLAARKLGSAGRQLLLEASRSDDLRVAIQAAVKLGPGPSWKPLFARALASERWTVRAAAVAAVKDATDRDTALAAAGRALVDPRREVRLAAARVLLRMGLEDRARAELIDAAAASPPHLPAATVLVSRWDDPRGYDALGRAAASEDQGLRAAAIASHALAEHISDPLVAALADPAPQLRIAAARAILESL